MICPLGGTSRDVSAVDVRVRIQAKSTGDHMHGYPKPSIPALLFASCSTLKLDPNARWRWRRKPSGGRC